jgi:hypothetical protein
MATNLRIIDAAPGQDVIGQPAQQRRVSDRLLAAHNYAYATGSRKLAVELQEILELIESDERITYNRRGVDALERARRWTALVDAREAYEIASEEGSVGLQAVRLRMHMAQELWRKGETS